MEVSHLRSNIFVALMCLCVMGPAIPSDALAGEYGPAVPESPGPGWTPLNPSPDSRLVYVSSSTGNDSFNGLSESTPKQTLAAAFALLRDGYPDWLLLRCNDSWSEAMPSWGKSGRSAAEPMVVRSYGTGERPLLLTGSSRGFDLTSYPTARAHLAITDIHCIAHTNVGTASDGGVEIVNSWSDVLIENCRFERYQTNISIQGLETRPRDIRIRRCVINGSIAVSGLSSGVLVGHADDILIEENLFDHNGWNLSIPGCTPTVFSHNVYINPDNTTGVITRGNIVARGAASGLRSSGWLCEDNLMLQNPVGLALGPDTRIVRRNVFLDSRNIDAANPRGLGMDGTIGPGVQIYDNTLAHQVSGTGNTRAISLGGVYNGLTLRHNVVYDWVQTVNSQAPALVLDGAPTGSVSVVDNQFQQNHGALIAQFQPVPLFAYTFARNLYFNTGTPSPFLAMPSPLTYAEWLARSGELGSQFEQRTYSAPDRSIATYMMSMGGAPSLDAFLSLAAQQSRQNWRPEFTAAAVNQYIRDGFDQALSVPCPIDINGNGIFEINDYLAFRALVLAGDLRADLTHDGLVNVADILAFQNLVSAGCP